MNLSSKYLGTQHSYNEELTIEEIRIIEQTAENENYDPYDCIWLGAVKSTKRKVQLVDGVLMELPIDYLDSLSPDFNGFWNKANQDSLQSYR